LKKRRRQPVRYDHRGPQPCGERHQWTRHDHHRPCPCGFFASMPFVSGSVFRVVWICTVGLGNHTLPREGRSL